MANLNTPNLKMNSDKYIFKKKSILRRKSKRKLYIESALMFILSILLVYLNYLIPNKISLFQNLSTNLNKSFILSKDLFISLYDIFVVLFILISSIVCLMLLIGTFYRMYKIVKNNTKPIR